MKTEQEQLLEEYTKQTQARCDSDMHCRRVLESLEKLHAKDSSKLNRRLTRLLKGTNASVQICHFWHLIDHSTRPVTSTLMCDVEIISWSTDPKVNVTSRFSFIAPKSVDEVYEYVKAKLESEETK